MEFYDRRLRSDEIRLLTLLPGKGREVIRCSLEIVPLDKLPAFDALSYAWGDPNTTMPIIVQNILHSATTNLFTALLTLRKPRKPRLLWVDALCINQEDLDEKNIQVPLMGKIYNVATHVIAWLGPWTEETQIYFKWTRTYVMKAFRASSVLWYMLDFAAIFSRRIRAVKDIMLLKVHLGRSQLAALPYWSRMWTFQEYQLARTEPVCICGRDVIRASELQASGQLISDRVASLMNRFEMRVNAAPGSNGSGLTFAETLVREEMFRDYEVKARDLHLPSYDSREGKDRMMALLLADTAERKCSEPLDKFYSLYGLCPGIQAMYPSDYRKELGTVQRETAAYIISHERDVPIYSLFRVRDGAAESESLPSWVPNFDRPTHFRPRDLHPIVPYHSMTDNKDGLGEYGSSLGNLGSAPALAIDDTLTVLHLAARDLGRCRITLRFGDNHLAVIDQLRHILQPDPASPLDEAMDRVACARIVRRSMAYEPLTSQYTVAELLATLDRLYSYEQSGSHDDLQNQDDICCLRTVQLLKRKTLFITEGGLSGFGLAAMSDGDIMILAPEIRTPLALRPKDRVSTDGVRGQHRLVGTAHVDGVALDPDADAGVSDELSQLEVKIFDIW